MTLLGCQAPQQAPQHRHHNTRYGDSPFNASETSAKRTEDKQMGRSTAIVLYVVFMAVVVVGVDFLFFRFRFWERLMVNVGIVLVFAAFYLRFLKQP
jgi:hypothetical protein